MGQQPSHSRRAVFLDRDGVINRMVLDAEFGTVDSPANPAEMELLPGVPQAIAALNRLGLLVIVVSNQPGIAKGRFSQRLLTAMQEKMKKTLFWEAAAWMPYTIVFTILRLKLLNFGSNANAVNLVQDF